MGWCKITAIVRRMVLETVEQQLQALGVPGITVSHVKGYGEYKDFYARDWSITHARIEIFTGRDDAERIVDTILAVAASGEPGDGIIAILPVDAVYRIRTGRSEAPSPLP